MRFGNHWKLIDLEGCLRTTGGVSVCQDNFTPLYASPELARFAIGDEAPQPCETMDTWAAGVLLLDVLESCAAFQETKSGFDSAALFEEESVPNESWYRWVADPVPLVLEEIVTTAHGRKMLRSTAHLQLLIENLLEKDPARRLSANDFLEHFLLLKESSADKLVDASSQALAPESDNKRRPVQACFERCSPDRGCLTRAFFYELMLNLGLSEADAKVLVDAVDPLQKTHLSYSDFLDVIFGPRPATS